MLPDSRIAGFSCNFRFARPRWLFSLGMGFVSNMFRLILETEYKHRIMTERKQEITIQEWIEGNVRGRKTLLFGSFVFQYAMFQLFRVIFKFAVPKTYLIVVISVTPTNPKKKAARHTKGLH